MTAADTEGRPVTLTVLSSETETLPERFFPTDGEYPRTCVSMTYTLTLTQPEGSFLVRDAGRGDRPRGRMSAGVIGGADGPVGLLLSHPEGEQERFHACSSLYFDPTPAVEWELIFRRVPHAAVTVELPVE